MTFGEFSAQCFVEADHLIRQRGDYGIYALGFLEGTARRYMENADCHYPVAVIEQAAAVRSKEDLNLLRESIRLADAGVMLQRKKRYPA